MQTTIEIDALHNGIDFKESINCVEFEDVLFRLIIKTVENAIRNANLTRNDIDTFILVGESTRIPKILELLQNQFDVKKICKAINADEAVAHGDAIQNLINRFFLEQLLYL